MAKKKMEESKKALDEATAEYLKKKKKRDQLQNDLSSSFTDAAKDLVPNKAQESEEKKLDECDICREKYNKLDRHSCAPKCGHLTCQECLAKLHEKLCPICREPFTENDVRKIYLK